MDSEDSRDGNKSSSSSSSSSRSGRSNSSASSVKRPHSPTSPPLSKSQTSRSQSPDSISQSSQSPSPKNILSPDNLSDAHSNINSPDNLDGGPKSPTFGPKTPESPPSPMSVDRSKPSTPSASPSSPARPVTPPTPPPASEAESRDSPSNDEQWKERSRGRLYGSRDKSSSRDRSRSESSRSSRDSTYNKRGIVKDPTTEAISDGEMESDQEETKTNTNRGQLDMSHEDLSDVSDLDSMCTEDIEKEAKSQLSASPKQEIKTNGISSPKQESDKNLDNKKPQESTEDVEDQLDFEAEEGECIEPKKAETNGVAAANSENQEESVEAGRRSRGSSLEEGEVSDEGERRPEENEPRPVCRFYSRGACTWGVSCRFLHPGVTDKGNYSMFEVVRGIPHPTTYPSRETVAANTPLAPESAWERGLRTAKEMVRIANKRKEQDMDFEEKKLHLSVGGVVHDPDAELAYAAAAVGASPPTEHAHHPHHDIAHRDIESFRGYGPMYRPQPRFPAGRPVLDERERYYERERIYERGERGFERIPPHFDDRVPPIDEAAFHKSRRVRSSREVIVQRAEGRGRDAREGRVDEWADPWMRASPATRRRKRASSDESYSSTSSHSSRSVKRKRRASSSSKQRVSPAAIVRERRLATARAAAMNPPAPRRRAPSPAAARQHAANPPPPSVMRYKDEVDQYGRRKPNRKRYSSTSGSDSSSSSSESESESRSSSSSNSSSEGARRGRNARLLNAAARPRLNAKSSAELAAAVSTAPSKKDVIDLESMKKKATASPPNDNNKSVSRREELLKQLKAVEDAIARKRSKT